MANAKPDETAVSSPITRTELVWPGKYNPDGTLREPPRVNLPFQVIERVNESRATREAKKGPQELSLFDVWEGDEGDTFDDGWRNKLIWGDNLLVMSSLLEKFAGKIDLIYIDPPFATGADFSLLFKHTDDGFDLTSTGGRADLAKDASILEEKIYRDTWGKGKASYLSMLSQRLKLMRDLLSPRGIVFVHLDENVGHEVKLLLDDVFGASAFRGEIVWQLGTGAKSRTFFSIQHNYILAYAPSEWVFNPDSEIMREPFAEGSLRTHFRNVDSDGRRYRRRVVGGKEYIYYADEGRLVGSVWTDVPAMVANSPIMGESTGYPTQKPEKLLQRIIEGCSQPGDLVADFFVGSGTTAVVAEKTGRRWIGCDLGRFAIHTARKRLLDLEGAQPFELLNLGSYERQYWQSQVFGNDGTTGEQAVFEYLAFILRLYGAEPVSGLTHLHGKKGRAMVHIGSVDSPVTIDEIDQAINECAALEQAGLHILGWEWEMGLYELMVKEAKKRGVNLLLLQIPREVMEQQAADKGDVQFFELAHLEFGVDLEGRAASVTLTDFVIPNTELIPAEVREMIDKWSDYIDYWAIDWDFRDDTFMQGWVTYRTRKSRKLELTSDPHTYEEPGTHTIVVKVIDIFGNDTSQAYELQVG